MRPGHPDYHPVQYNGTARQAEREGAAALSSAAFLEEVAARMCEQVVGASPNPDPNPNPNPHPNPNPNPHPNPNPNPHPNPNPNPNPNPINPDQEGASAGWGRTILATTTQSVKRFLTGHR